MKVSRYQVGGAGVKGGYLTEGLKGEEGQRQRREWKKIHSKMEVSPSV